MLPIVLVLLVATSALAAPGVHLSIKSINDVVPPKHNGGIVSAFYTDQASEIVDGGDINTYTTTAVQIIHDLANQGDRKSQALALAQLIGLLGTLATGIPGDSCTAAAVIDAYVRGNPGSLRTAISRFIQSLLTSIDLIVKLATNPASLRFATGPRGNCNAGGRIYQFEGAWDSILSNAPPSSAGLLNEQYCSAKRLYNAFSAQSNNAGAFITAASLPPVIQIVLKALEPLAKFVASVSSGNPGPFAPAAKKALLRAADY